MNPKKKARSGLNRVGRVAVLVLAFVLALLVLPAIQRYEIQALQQEPVEPAQSAAAQQEVTQAEPEEEEKEKYLCTVCIDPGHGGNDGGSVYGDRKESDDALAVAKLVQKYLEKQNVKVVMTRTKDVYVELKDRAKTANEAKADYFVSIHRNLNPQGCGVETWTRPKCKDETLHLAQAIQNAIVKVGVQQDRGVKHGTQESPTSSYYVLRRTKMPGVLLELGFIDNQEDNRLLDQNRKAYAKAIANAVIATYQEYHGEDTDDEPQK